MVTTAQKQIIRKYQSMRAPLGRHYNSVKAQLQRTLPPSRRRPYVERDRWLRMHTDEPTEAMPHTINEIVLGENFILACFQLDIDWERHIRTRPQFFPRHLKRLTLGDQTLGEIFEDAWDQVDEYNYVASRAFEPKLQQFAPLFNEETQSYELAKIGDKVEYPRTSVDELEEIYGESTEERVDHNPDLPHDPTRYDGDARWSALSDSEYELLQNRGRWVPAHLMTIDPDGFSSFLAPNGTLLYWVPVNFLLR